MPILNERDRREVQEQLKALTGPVKLVNFTQELACQIRFYGIPLGYEFIPFLEAVLAAAEKKK